MNPRIQEQRFNKRANKHTFVVRMYTGKSGKSRAYMVVMGKLMVLCEDGEWRKVIYRHNSTLSYWAKRVFGVSK